ncbi:hypothetical protein V5799_012777, partial [Amblyomma americanum]
RAKANQATSVMAASTVTSFVDTGEKTNVLKGDKSTSATSANSTSNQASASERHPIFLLSADYSRREKYYRATERPDRCLVLPSFPPFPFFLLPLLLRLRRFPCCVRKEEPCW